MQVTFQGDQPIHDTISAMWLMYSCNGFEVQVLYDALHDMFTRCAGDLPAGSAHPGYNLSDVVNELLQLFEIEVCYMTC